MPELSTNVLQVFQARGCGSWLFWLGGVLLALPMLAAGEPGELNWRYLVDEEGVLSPAPDLWTVRTPEWRELQRGVMSFGFSRAAYWLHARLPEQMPDAAAVVLANSRLDAIEVFQYRDGQLVQHFQLGDRLPFQERFWPHRLFAIPLAVEDASADILLRIRSDGLLQVPLRLLSVAELNQQQRQEERVWAVAVGALFALMLLHALLVWKVRRGLHLKLLVLMLLLILLQAYMAGFTYPLLWPGSPTWQNQSGPLLAVLALAALSLFALDLMRMAAARERWRRFARGWLGICVLALFAALLLPVWLGLRLALLFGLIAYLLAILPVGLLRANAGLARNRLVGAWLLLWLSFGLGMAGELGFLGKKPWSWSALLLPVLSLMPLSLSLLLEEQDRHRRLLQRQASAVRQLRHARQRRAGLTEAVRLLRQQLRSSNREIERLRMELAIVDGSGSVPALANRAMFDRGYRNEWQRAYRERKQLSLALCQLDHYDRLASQYGEAVAERSLRALGAILQALFQRPTDLVARFAPDMIVVLAADTPQTAAFRLVEQARQQLAQEQVLQGQLMLSAGIASTLPDERHHQAVLLSFANDALCRARKAGGNRSVCYRQPQAMEQQEQRP